MAAQLGPRRRAHADRHRGAAVGRVGLPHHDVRNVGAVEARRELAQAVFVRHGQNDRERTLVEISGARLARRVNELGSNNAFWEILPDDHEVGDGVRGLDRPGANAWRSWPDNNRTSYGVKFHANLRAMSRHVLVAVLLAVGACNTPAGSFSPAPVPPMPPAPLVVGHWMLEASTTGEHLWIEADGTFSEAGGSPFDVGGPGTISEGETWSGPWAFVAPDALTLDDARTGAHRFSAFLHGSELVLQMDPTHTYRFQPDPADAGAD